MGPQTGGTHHQLADGDAQFVISAALDTAVRLSSTGVIEWVSPSLRRILGRNPADMVGVSFHQFVHPGDLDILEAREQVTNDGEHAPSEIRLRCSDGSYRWVSHLAVAVPDGSGAAVGSLTWLRDVHDEVERRRRSEVRIRRLETAFASMPIPCAWLEALRHRDGKIVDFVVTAANQAAFHRVHPLEPVGSTLSTLAPAEHFPFALRHFLAVLDTGEPIAADGIQLRLTPGGSSPSFDVRISRIDENSLCATWLDVSDRAELERIRVRAAASRARSIERARIARDLHDSLLQRVLACGMLTATLRNGVTPAHVQTVDHLLDVYDEVVLEFRSITLEMTDPEIDELGLATCLDRALDEVARLLGFRPTIGVIGRLDDIDTVVAGQLIRSLRELLANVVRHAEATRVTTAVEVAEGQVRLTVADNGVGAGVITTGGHGLSNLRARALELGGSFSIAAANGGGTVATWVAPTSASSNRHPDAAAGSMRVAEHDQSASRF